MRELPCKNLLWWENSFKGHSYCMWSPTCLQTAPKGQEKWRKQTFFYQNQDSDNPGQNSLGQYFNIHIFVSFLGSLLKQCILFEIFLQFCLPPPYTKLKLGKILDTCVQHYLWGEGRGGVGPVWIGKRPRNVPRRLSMIVGKFIVFL